MSPAVIARMTHVAVAVTALRSVESCGKWTHHSGELTPAAAVVTQNIQDWWVHVSRSWKCIFLYCVLTIFHGISQHRLVVSQHWVDLFLSVKLQDGPVEFFRIFKLFILSPSLSLFASLDQRSGGSHMQDILSETFL